MQQYIAIGTDVDILNEIGKWKVIALKGLYQSLNQQRTYTPFTKQVQMLERAGLVRAFAKKKTKYLVLTNEGRKVSKYNNCYDENEDFLNHDLHAANVLRQLLMFENFKDGHMFSDDKEDVDPDAVIRAVRGGREYTLAIEVELTQKSRVRLMGKFSKYGKSQFINHVLYVFNKEAIFESYKKVLAMMDDTVQGKVILCSDTGLSIERFNYIDSQCWHRMTSKTFEKIFK